MTIIFRTRDGRTVETTDKDVLIAAAKNGEIGPDSLVEVNGKTYLAKKIQGLTFGDPTPPAPPVASPAKPSPGGTLSKRDQRNIDTLTSCHWLISGAMLVGSVAMMPGGPPASYCGLGGIFVSLVYFKFGGAVIGFIAERLKK